MTLTNERVAQVLRGIRPYTVPDDIDAVTKAAQDAMDKHSDPSDAGYAAALAAVRKRRELSGVSNKRPYEV